jgi:hypothetical protein
MSRFRYRNLELLEPYEGKLSRTVLRGEGGSNAADLLDIIADPFCPAKRLCVIFTRDTSASIKKQTS